MSFLGWIALLLFARWIYSAFTQSGTQQSYTRAQQQGARANSQDFELHLLSLTSVIIKADGRVTQNELDYVRQYFVGAYGKDRANAVFKTFNEVVKNKQVDPARICMYINARTRYESRLQILHFLFNISQADGHVSPPELQVLEQIAGYLKLTNRDYVSIKAMFVKDQDNAYKILEIDKTASDVEVKKAFREMAKRYHPDKLMDMDEAYRKGAQDKFNAVQTAYDQIRKERGMA